MTSRDLMVVRHAKSDWTSKLASDSERPLNTRGEKDAPHIAKWIHQQQLLPDLLLCSPARRTKQTADAIIKELHLSPSSVIYDKRLYLASTATLLTVIAEYGSNHNSLMLVGHNPGLEELVMKLSADPLPFTEDGKLLTTANFVMLRFDSSWPDLSDNQGQLIHFMRPKEIS